MVCDSADGAGSGFLKMTEDITVQCAVDVHQPFENQARLSGSLTYSGFVGYPDAARWAWQLKEFVEEVGRSCGIPDWKDRILVHLRQDLLRNLFTVKVDLDEGNDRFVKQSLDMFVSRFRARYTDT